MFFPVHPFKDETTSVGLVVPLSGQESCELKQCIDFKTDERKTFVHSRQGIDNMFKVCKMLINHCTKNFKIIFSR